MIVNRCLDCQHRTICKYKEEYEKVLSNIKCSIDSPFKLILDCDYYFNNTSYYSLNQWDTSQSTHNVAYGYNSIMGVAE